MTLNKTDYLGRRQNNWQRLNFIQAWRVDFVEGSEQSIEAVGDFGQFRILDLQPHSVAQSPYL